MEQDGSVLNDYSYKLEVAGQEVFHAHLHVIPRFRSGGFGVRFGAHYGLRPDKEELDRIVLSIKKGMH